MSDSPPCKVCGKTEWVCVWREEAPQDAVCVECCDHPDGYEYDSDQGCDACIICSSPAPSSRYGNEDYGIE